MFLTNLCRVQQISMNKTPQQLTPENVVDAYRSACEKQSIKPINRVITQLECIPKLYTHNCSIKMKYCVSVAILKRLECFQYSGTGFKLERYTLINVAKKECNRLIGEYAIGEKLDPRHCEALEEILKRIQFRTIDLEACNLDDEGATALFDMIEYYESATRLNISGNKNIDIRGWQACCRMLKNTSCLQHLDLRNSGLSEQIMLTFGRALRLGSHLITLHLESSGISSRSLAILIAALKLNTNLRELYLGNNKLTQNDAIQIGNLLKANSTLELLDLRGNQLQDIGLSYITEGLSQQPFAPGDGLKTLILNDNQITGKGMSHLVDAMPLCHSLKGLSLSNNNIGNDGVIRLKDGLLASTTLLYLGLRSTKITCEGAVSIAEYVAENKSLQRLDLRENNIQTAGLMALALSIKHNTNIIRVDINGLIPPKDSAVFENCQQFVEEIENCAKNNYEAENNEIDDDYIQGLESPDSSSYESSSISFNGVFKNRSINISLPGLSKKESTKTTSNAINIPSTRPRFRVSRVCVEHEDKVPNTDNLNDNHSSLSFESFEMHVYGYNNYISLPNTQQQHSSQPKPILRSTSLSSWDSRYSEKEVRRSGRFSVSPVPDSEYNSSRVKRLQEEDEEFKSEASSSSPDSAKEENLSNEVESGNESGANLKENGNDLETEVTSAENGNVQKPKRKISFLLPEKQTESLDSGKYNHNRRMSTPAMSTAATKKHRSRVPSLKMFKTLESLDLKSSVPLSPTRLCQGWDFPVTALRLPPEVEEVIMKLELLPLDD
ncbi:protein phosphatase 1 regulatory subunit 37-like protein [Leptotrombidium deliense]|uniref:Protein phosphatase 1 regulatory subunit 37-like protein n=1 Tax=Leptotrombidium deliense TaxID=299467 RepID=A0A443STC9_9ACAR|nr:protein phosphatase 1 regulatory subunit 37-like protein [Leptotrombidium deliense]